MKTLKTCSEEDLNKFINNYPRKLVRDVSGIWEPPLVSYNDFTLGNWPDSVVASYRLGYELDLPYGYRVATND